MNIYKIFTQIYNVKQNTSQVVKNHTIKSDYNVAFLFCFYAYFFNYFSFLFLHKSIMVFTILSIENFCFAELMSSVSSTFIMVVFLP